MNLFDRLVESRLKGDAMQSPVHDDDRSTFPIVMQFLTRTDAGDSHLKDPAQITIKASLGTFVVELTDPSLECSVSAASPTLVGCLPALEAELNKPQPLIRTWRGAKGKLTEKPKKKA